MFKKIIFGALFSILFISCNKQNKTHLEEIQQFQYKLNTEFADIETTPLTKPSFNSFIALDFFEINDKYRVVATFERTPNEPVFEMPTTTDRLPLYKKYGIATFKLEGKTHTLHIFQNLELITKPEYADYLFLPFYDKTNGTTSYGGGRYIDMRLPEENATTIVIDFNKAYNPYCAYNDKYSCPIPPKENRLEIAIPAGVKAFKKY